MTAWHFECPDCGRVSRETGGRDRGSYIGYFCRDCLYAHGEYVRMTEVADAVPDPIAIQMDLFERVV